MMFFQDKPPAGWESVKMNPCRIRMINKPAHPIRRFLSKLMNRLVKKER